MILKINDENSEVFEITLVKKSSLIIYRQKHHEDNKWVHTHIVI